MVSRSPYDPHMALTASETLMIAAGVNAKALQSFMGTPTFGSRWTATGT